LGHGEHRIGRRNQPGNRNLARPPAQPRDPAAGVPVTLYETLGSAKPRRMFIICSRHAKLAAMSLLARTVVPGVPHHVTQRGNHRQPVFFGDDDYSFYRDLIAAAATLAGTEVWA